MHETIEADVVVRESHRHQHITDHVRYRHGQRLIQINHLSVKRTQHIQELFDFIHYTGFHLQFTTANVGHAEMAQAVMHETALFLPQLSRRIYHACKYYIIILEKILCKYLIFL